MKGCLGVLLVIIVLLISAVWYVFRPITLGVTYTEADISSAKQKLGIIQEPLPTGSTGKTIIVSGAHPVDKTFSSQELTALADTRYKTYAYFPFRNVQIRIHTDGSVEGKATIGFQDAVRYLLTLGVAQKDIEEGVKKFSIPNTTLPVYLKVSGSITHNQSAISVENATIAKIPIPVSYIQQYTPALNDLVENVIEDRNPSYNIEKLEVVDGAIHFKGTSPDREQAVISL